jgi:hypothetical protein
MSKESGSLLVLASAISIGIAYLVVTSSTPEPHKLSLQETAFAKGVPGSGVGEPAHEREAFSPVARAVPKALVLTAEPSGSSGAPQFRDLPRTAPLDRTALARELQRELRRVGCYDGELNGTWTPSTRRGMKAFTERVNATLPVEEPDQILLALVRGHKDRACGVECPAGQSLSADGQCLPNAIRAQIARGASRLATNSKPAVAPTGTAAPVIQAWSTTTTSTGVGAAPVPLASEARMALAGPNAQSGALGANEGSAAGDAGMLNAAQVPPGPAASSHPVRQAPPRKRAAFGPTLFRQLERSSN